MKLNKKQLKELIVECLIEILTDKKGSLSSQSVSEARAPVPAKPLTPKRNPEQAKILKEIAGADPIMQAIFQETAQTTAIEQARAEEYKQPKGVIESAIFNKDPEEIFGTEMTNRWANLI